MTAKVPITDMGRLRLGMTVARRLRMNRKMTSTTRPKVSSRVNWMSATEARMATLASRSTARRIEAGRLAAISGSRSRTASATSMVFMPGCFSTARMMVWARESVVKNQAPDWSSSTLSVTRATSLSRIGRPSRTATTTSR